MSKIEFQNGSVIETVGTTDSVRSRIRGYVDNVKTEVTICNSQGCRSNSYGVCRLPGIKIRDGECESFKEEDNEED